MKYQITRVTDKKGKKAFVNFPHDLYKDDPNYVPEIFMGQMDILNEKKYPFFEYGTVALYLAKDNSGKIVGRIAAIDNPNYNKVFGTHSGFFGFFDCIDDADLATQLLAKAEAYAREKGHNHIIGPTNYTTNETAGMLIDGFDDPPKIMMTYNAAYYPKLVAAAGYQKEQDLYAYMIKTATVSEKSLRVAGAIEERLARKGITVRNINLKNLDQEAEGIKQIYNSAWEENWGFVPFTDAEFKFLKNDLKMLADERFIYIAEHEGKTVGFGITVANINEILQKNKRGKLFPFGIFRLLMGKNKTKYVRILALGVLADYRRMGIEAIFFAKNIQEAKRRGIIGGEASWVLESNQEMINAAERLGGERYKTYRLFQKQLS